MSLINNSGHLAWCGLVALALAKQDGSVQSPVQEELFLMRWLSTALRQRRFSRSVSPDIEWLLKQGRRLGVSAGLTGKLNYLWSSCSGNLSEQSDLFRLTYAIESIKENGWIYQVLSDSEWSGRCAVVLDTDINGIYIARTILNSAFDADGHQRGLLTARFIGKIEDVSTILMSCGWNMERGNDPSQPFQYQLLACSSPASANNKQFQIIN